MNRYERDEIDTLPSKYRPVGAWGYFGYTLLFSIPIIGQIFLIVFALSGSNVNRRSFARSYFCGVLIVLIIFVIIVGIMIVAGGGINNLLPKLQEFFMGIVEKIKNLIPQA